jgi:hypothetical protein
MPVLMMIMKIMTRNLLQQRQFISLEQILIRIRTLMNGEFNAVVPKNETVL